jgi:hypothetical protein
MSCTSNEPSGGDNRMCRFPHAAMMEWSFCWTETAHSSTLINKDINDPQH